MLRSVVLLRHAAAGSRSAWSGDDAHRPLDVKGLSQAARLVDALDGVHVDEIWTSPLIRCLHTVAPLAAQRRLPVVPTPWLAPDTDPSSLDSGLATLRGSVMLCTHGECVAPILLALTEGREAVADLRKGEALCLDWDADGVLVSIRRIQRS